MKTKCQSILRIMLHATFASVIASCIPPMLDTIWTITKLAVTGAQEETYAIESVVVPNCGIPVRKTTDCSAGTSNDLSFSFGSGASVGLFSVDAGAAASLGIGKQSGESISLDPPPNGYTYEYSIRKTYHVLSGQAVAKSSTGAQQVGNFVFHASCSIDVEAREQRSCSDANTPNTNPPIIDPKIPTQQQRPGSASCDDFNYPTLSPGWNWIDPRQDSWYSLEDNPGYLRITVSGRDHDLYMNMNAPRMLQPIAGEFTATTKVTIYPTANYQGAGLLFWQDENNFIRLERTLVQGVDSGGRIRGEQIDAIEIPLDVPTVYLRYQLENTTLRRFYSIDGMNVIEINPVSILSNAANQIGLTVINEWQDGTTVADFDFFKIGDCQ